MTRPGSYWLIVPFLRITRIPTAGAILKLSRGILNTGDLDTSFDHILFLFSSWIVVDFADTNHVAGMVIKELPASIMNRVRYMESFSADITHLFTILRTINAKDSASKIPPTTILELGPGKRTRA